MDLGPNQHLIGRQGGRASLNTPALVLELDLLKRNIAVMADFGKLHRLALRPHTKTHKCPRIAALQLAAGAVGLCCAKLGEAEVMAEAGLGPLLITSPVIGAEALERLAALALRAPGLAVVADDPQAVATLAAALYEPGLTVLVDIDPGLHRTGVASADAAVALAREIARQPNIGFGGVQFFSGASQHIEDYAERLADVELRTAYLAKVVAALIAAGLPPPVVTGGGTGTHVIDAALGVMTELQVGSYVFMDDQYNACALYPEDPDPFEIALKIDARVISANWPGMVTVDAGLKASTGSPLPPQPLAGTPDGSRYEYRGDEHGAILWPQDTGGPALGAVVTLATPHCDPTVNLYDVLHVVRGDTLIDIWPIAARGRGA